MSEPMEGEVFSVAGRKVACEHCGGDRFEQRYYSLETTFRRGIFADTATVFICTGCGRVAWFVEPPIDTREEDAAVNAEEAPWLPAEPASGAREAEETTCLKCGAAIPADKEACPACGWTYR